MKKHDLLPSKKHLIRIAIFCAIIILLPIFVKDDYVIRILTEIFFFAALGEAWNIIGGFAGQTSWASDSFFVCGGFAALILFVDYGISPWIGMWVGAAITVVLALIIGLPTLRLRGVYFAIATISCSTIFRQILLNMKITNGSVGRTLMNMSHELDFLSLNFPSNQYFYYIAFVWMLVVVAITAIIKNTYLGYYLRAISCDEDAANAMGMKTYKTKVMAFIISAILISISGSFYAFKVAFVNPNSMGSHDMAVRIAVVAIIGGMGTVWGPVLGAFIGVFVYEMASLHLAHLGGGGAGYAIYGLAIVLIVLLRPNGLISLGEPIKKFLVSKFKKVSKEGVTNG